MKKILSLLIALGALLYAVSTENILALSWENSFCVIKPYDRGCRVRSRYSYGNFVLHGLWPKRTYCKNYYKFELSPRVAQMLQDYMPNISLAKHEWKKHGTCFGSNADVYFLTAIKLTKEFNNSKFVEFVRMHIGEYLSLERLRYEFGKSFGYRNKRKFQLICKRKNGINYIVEIRLFLKGDPIMDDLRTLINNARELRKKQCQGGVFE